MSTVRVRCHTRHGLVLRVGNVQIRLAGNDGITEVDSSLWSEWLREHRDSPIIRSGQLYEIPAEVTEPEGQAA